MTEEELKTLKAEVDALKAKNAELLDEKKKAQKKAEEEARGREKAEGDLTSEKARLEEEAARKAGDWAKLETSLKERFERDLKAEREKVAALESARDRLVIDNAISSQIDAIGVAPHFKPAVQAMIKTANKVAVDIVDGQFVGKIGDKAIADYFAAWAATDEAKHFIANANSGGGGKGGKGDKGAGGVVNPWAKETRNMTAQGRIEKEDPALAVRLKKEAGLA